MPALFFFCNVVYRLEVFGKTEIEYFLNAYGVTRLQMGCRKHAHYHYKFVIFVSYGYRRPMAIVHQVSRVLVYPQRQ